MFECGSFLPCNEMAMTSLTGEYLAPQIFNLDSNNIMKVGFTSDSSIQEAGFSVFFKRVSLTLKLASSFFGEKTLLMALMDDCIY